MKTETRQYKDVSGNPVTLDWLVKNEPEWAANQIRHLDKLEAKLEDAIKLLRFQEMHKSAEILTDQTRMDWLLKNSCIIVSGIYLTCRESLDAAMVAAESANGPS